MSAPVPKEVAPLFYLWVHLFGGDRTIVAHLLGRLDIYAILLVRRREFFVRFRTRRLLLWRVREAAPAVGPNEGSDRYGGKALVFLPVGTYRKCQS